MPAPIHYKWNGHAMVPLRRYAQLCLERFTIGETYRLEEARERSMVSHRHEFAWLHEAWMNLPERLAGDPITLSPEHLRKHALIHTGWADCQSFPCNSKAEAQRWAARLKPLDDYAIVLVRGTVVERYTAKSQSKRSMGAKAFQQSKSDIMDWVEDLIAVPRGTLAREEETENVL